MKFCDLLVNVPYKSERCDGEISRVTYDSSDVCPGDLFVCLKGASRDGHDFAPDAYEKGCRAFLCERELDLPADAQQATVADCRAALPVISAEFFGHPADKLKIIGITGTKGKTTTALLVSAILNAAGKSCAYIGSNGVIINGKHRPTVNTTPESLRLHAYFSEMISEKTEYAVLEVSSQALARHRTDGIPFDTVAFTNLSEDHIGGAEHPTFEDYRDSKKKLFTDYGAKTAVYCADDEYGDYMTDSFSGRKISFGIGIDADFKGENIRKFRNDTALGVAFDCVCGGISVKTDMLSPGGFSVYNGLCAMAICSVYGVEKEFSAEVLGKTTVQGRSEIVPVIPGRTFVIDYAHNGLSLTSVLKTLREYEPERIICVFGSVGGRTQVRRKELAQASSALADYVIITSDNPDFEDPAAVCEDIASYMTGDVPYEIIPDRYLAIERAAAMSQKGDIVLLAGKGHENYQLICGKKVPFSEREVLERISAAMAVK